LRIDIIPFTWIVNSPSAVAISERIIVAKTIGMINPSSSEVGESKHTVERTHPRPDPSTFISPISFKVDNKIPLQFPEMRFCGANETIPQICLQVIP